MKRLLFLCLSAVIMNFASAQDVNMFMDEPSNSFNGGFGITWIDGTAFTTFTIAPEFAFGKFGVGLNIELLFNNSEGFKFRKDGWDKGAGALRMIRYLRWGLKHDPVYVRVGSLQSATLGNGFIMGYYSNEANYDYRKIGLEFDLDFKYFGLETVTSNLGNLEIIGGRLYVRPLMTTDIPIIKNFEVGGTYVTDLNPDNLKDTRDSFSEWGLDIGLPLLKLSYLNWKIYADYAKINNFGDGTAVGTSVSIPNFIGMFGIYAKLEKRFLNDQFLPNYFNTLYELERRNLPASYYPVEPGSTPFILSKADYLKTVGKTEGIFGELAGQILGKIRLAGSYQHLNKTPNGGILHLEARSRDLIPSVQLLYTYDKVGIETFKDVRTLDYRSVAIGEIGYKLYPFLYVTLQYRWNWVRDAESGEYKSQERFQPGMRFSIDF